MLLPSSEESGSGCDRLCRQVSGVDWLKVLGIKARKAWAQRRQQIGPSAEDRWPSWSVSVPRTTTVVFGTRGERSKEVFTSLLSMKDGSDVKRI
jgi:hypothetical protein